MRFKTRIYSNPTVEKADMNCRTCFNSPVAYKPFYYISITQTLLMMQYIQLWSGQQDCMAQDTMTLCTPSIMRHILCRYVDVSSYSKRS
jgi:hypothetical protein